MLNAIFKKKISYIILILYGIIVLWWLRINTQGIRETDENYLFGGIYALIALIGGINGLIVSKFWGGHKSFVGRGIIFLSLGLIGEWFGQTAWTYYNVIVKINVPYPSWADLGYLSIIPLYSLGMLSLAKATGSQFSLKKIKGKLILIIIPVIMGCLSYYLFLKNFNPDLSQPVRTFLDLAYPLGEVIPISIALITFGLSNSILGGKMRGRILCIIFAFIAQYITDYTFLYRAAQNSYYNGGPVDLMYATSFTIMSLGLIAFNSYD